MLGRGTTHAFLLRLKLGKSFIHFLVRIHFFFFVIPKSLKVLGIIIYRKRKQVLESDEPFKMK